jgi:hypothetical protein
MQVNVPLVVKVFIWLPPLFVIVPPVQFSGR